MKTILLFLLLCTGVAFAQQQGTGNVIDWNSYETGQTSNETEQPTGLNVVYNQGIPTVINSTLPHCLFLGEFGDENNSNFQIRYENFFTRNDSVFRVDVTEGWLAKLTNGLYTLSLVETTCGEIMPCRTLSKNSAKQILVTSWTYDTTPPIRDHSIFIATKAKIIFIKKAN